MSAFQHVSFCPSRFQHVSFSACQLLPEQISAFQLFSVSAFARVGFSFCLGNFSISECLSSVFSLPSSVFPLPSLRVVFLSHFCFLLSALSADSSFSVFQLVSFCLGNFSFCLGNFSLSAAICSAIAEAWATLVSASSGGTLCSHRTGYPESGEAPLLKRTDSLPGQPSHPMSCGKPLGHGPHRFPDRSGLRESLRSGDYATSGKTSFSSCSRFTAGISSCQPR